MPEPRLGVGAAIVRDGKLLLFRRLRPPEAGTFSIPGGKIDFQEPVEDGLRREVFEETGLTLRALKLLCVSDLIWGRTPEHWVSPIYLATDVAGEPAIREPEKHADLGWFSLDRPPIPLSTAAQDALRCLKALEGQDPDRSRAFARPGKD